MRLLIAIGLIAVGLMAMGAAESTGVNKPIPAKQWTEKAKVWTARSCVGEAGFDAVEECMAIAWVYATRANDTSRTYLWIVKRYSSAIKRHDEHDRPWIFELNADGEKPENWPPVLSWKRHRPMWSEILEGLDAWAKGDVPNPVPGANHYGSVVDARRALYVRKWTKLEAPGHFRNWFFDSKTKGKVVYQFRRN